MAKSELTLFLEQNLFDMYKRRTSLFGINEVKREVYYPGVGYKTEICDFITLERGHGGVTIRCYEIKISKADFHSNNANSFWGDYNYYCMPDELYLELKDEIPREIGVVGRDGAVLKKATKFDLYTNERNDILLAIFYRLFSVARGNSPKVLVEIEKMFGGKQDD